MELNLMPPRYAAGQIVAVPFVLEREDGFYLCEALVKSHRLHMPRDGDPYYIYTVSVCGVMALFHEAEILFPFSLDN